MSCPSSFRFGVRKFWLLLAALILILSQLACQALTPNIATPTSEQLVTPQTNTITPDRTTTLVPDATLALTDSPEDGTPQPSPTQLSAKLGMACFGSAGSGLTCLEGGSWFTFTEENSLLGSNNIKDVAVCQDGGLLIAHDLGINAFNGENWEQYESGWGPGSVEAVACDSQDGIWVAHFGGVSFFDGQEWTEYSSDQLSSGETATDLVGDVVIAYDGTVWVVTANSVAAFDGTDWTVFQDGQGFDQRYLLKNATLDGQGYPLVGHSSGVLSYDGTKWTNHENHDLGSAESVAVDNFGRLWVGTLSHGLFALGDGAWVGYDLSDKELASNHVRALAVDDNGRLWVGTDWGLLVVLNGEAHQIYRMDNSNLVANDVSAMAVVAGGPLLPATMIRDPGSMSGRILDQGRRPLTGAPVEICVEKIGSMFFGETPCSDQPFQRRTLTDADGNFQFLELPAGFYVIVVYTGDRWTQLTTKYGVVSERVLVEAGENTDVGELQLQNSK